MVTDISRKLCNVRSHLWSFSDDELISPSLRFQMEDKGWDGQVLIDSGLGSIFG